MAIVNIPNNSMRDGNPGSTSTAGKTASPTHPANMQGGFPVGTTAGPVQGNNGVKPDNHQFRLADAKMPEQASGGPSKGAVPVDPYRGAGGMTVASMKLPERAGK